MNNGSESSFALPNSNASAMWHVLQNRSCSSQLFYEQRENQKRSTAVSGVGDEIEVNFNTKVLLIFNTVPSNLP